MNQIEVMKESSAIEVYSPIVGQLAEIKSANAQLVFDYEDPADNKKARSYIYKLRQLKALTDKKRKEAKAESLNYGRMVDSEAKKITSEIEEMIDIHAVPIAEIEQRETDRINAIRARISEMGEALEWEEPIDSAEISARLASVKAVAINDLFAEFVSEAAQMKDNVTSRLELMLESALKSEAEAAELARLRKEAEERAAKDREEQIRKEAAERATREAEEKRKAEIAEAEAVQQREKEAAERRELELKLSAERAEREKLEAQRRAEQAEAEADARVKREAAAKIEQENERRKDAERVSKIKAEIVTEMRKYEKMSDLVDAMVDGKIPFVTVNI